MWNHLLQRTVVRLRESKAFRFARPFVLAVSAGLLLAAAFPPLNWRDCVWFALVPLCGVVAAPSGLAAYLGGYFGGFAFYIVALDWIRTSYGGSGLSGSWVLAWFLAAEFLALPWVVVIATARLLFRRLCWSMPVSMACAWGCGMLATQCVALLTTGVKFPWLDLAGPQVERLWVIQVADLGGSFLVAVLIAFINGVVWCVITRRDRRRAVTLGLAVLATTILYGCWRLDGGADSRKISVALMAASSHPSTLDDAACQSVRGVDFLLWPEEVLGGDGLSQSETIQNLLKCANRCQSAVMIGWSRNTGLPKLINSAAFVRAESRTCQFYEKTCLVPWAEQVPSLADLSASLGSAESRATDPTTFELKHATIGPAICFDVCLPETLRRYRDCDLIAVCGSEMADSTGCLRELMLQMARLRAVEFRRPIARSVKAGYSGVISSSGAMLCKYAEHGLREPIRVEGIALGRQTTLYSILGIWSPAFTLGAIVLAVWASARFHNVMRLLPAKQHRTPVNRDISGEPCLQEPRTFRRRHY